MPLLDPPRLSAPPPGSFVPGVFWRPSAEFADALAGRLRGSRVLEVFGGNGYLAALLSERGVDILCTSVLSSMDAHERGLYFEVEDLDAREACRLHGGDRDVLLMCWPTVTDAALQACELWGEKPIAFIGEFTDYSKGHLGGCATDSFFERFRVAEEFPSYRGNMLERACLGTLGPSPRPDFPPAASARRRP